MLFVISALIGLVCGSFFGLLYYRIPNNKDFIFGRSVCTSCNEPLSYLDLIPVVSWIILKGRCRYCKNDISLSYIIIEVLTCILFIVSAIFLGDYF